MFRLINILLIFAVPLNCKAQQVVDLATDHDFEDEMENGNYYYKDINNYF